MQAVPVKNALPQNSIFHKLIKMLLAMVAFEPVMMNIIAIGLALCVLLLLAHPVFLPPLGKYHAYLTYGIYMLVALQTIKSATKSLFIPFMLLALASIGFLAININPEWHFLSIDLLKKTMLLGLLGVATSVLVIR